MPNSNFNSIEESKYVSVILEKIEIAKIFFEVMEIDYSKSNQEIIELQTAMLEEIGTWMTNVGYTPVQIQEYQEFILDEWDQR